MEKKILLNSFLIIASKRKLSTFAALPIFTHTHIYFFFSYALLCFFMFLGFDWSRHFCKRGGAYTTIGWKLDRRVLWEFLLAEIEIRWPLLRNGRTDGRTDEVTPFAFVKWIILTPPLASLSVLLLLLLLPILNHCTHTHTHTWTVKRRPGHLLLPPPSSSSFLHRLLFTLSSGSSSTFFVGGGSSPLENYFAFSRTVTFLF